MTVEQIKTVLEQHKLWLLCNGGTRADLRGADLRRADLRGAYLTDAHLRGADLTDADLRGADLRGADKLELARTEILPREGEIIAWKKASGCVVKLRVPPLAKRSNATGRKCRAEFVEVLEIIGNDLAISNHDGKTEYKVGETVRCDSWCEDRWIECAGGIHFFLTREEAEAY